MPTLPDGGGARSDLGSLSSHLTASLFSLLLSFLGGGTPQLLRREKEGNEKGPIAFFSLFFSLSFQLSCLYFRFCKSSLKLCTTSHSHPPCSTHASILLFAASFRISILFLSFALHNICLSLPWFHSLFRCNSITYANDKSRQDILIHLPTTTTTKSQKKKTKSNEDKRLH